MKKHKNLILTALAAALLLAGPVGSALGYFTANTGAVGSKTIEMGDTTTVTENFSEWTKHVAVTSEEDSQPVYIRIKAFCGSEYSLVYSDGDGSWTPGSEGYYYYNPIVYAGETTSPLDIRIENVPADVKDADSFNVVVIYESTPVQYRVDGTPYADWSLKLTTGTTEGGM